MNGFQTPTHLDCSTAVFRMIELHLVLKAPPNKTQTLVDHSMNLHSSNPVIKGGDL